MGGNFPGGNFPGGISLEPLFSFFHVFSVFLSFVSFFLFSAHKRILSKLRVD